MKMILNATRTINHLPVLLTNIRRHFVVRLLLSVALAVSANSIVSAQEKAPERGFRPGGSYALSDIETISTTSGNMIVTVPLASLPPGRGGLAAGLNLIYNSKLYDSFPSRYYDTLNEFEVTRLKVSQAGGRRYGYKYELYDEGRDAGLDENGPIDGCASFDGYVSKLSLLTPDGGKHQLRLAGRTDSNGYQNILWDGTGLCGASSVTTTLSYYTTDGTFLRLDVAHDSDSLPANNPWTLYLPDGGRVTGGSSSQKVYDRNNNYIEIVNGVYGGHSATYLNDQVGRSIVIEYESASNQDSIHAVGFDGATLTTIVSWTNIQVRKFYLSEVGPAYDFHPIWRSVSQITLPSQAGSLSYSFAYNADGSTPTTVGWGEIKSITLPSGAKSNYTYEEDTHSSIDYSVVLLNRPKQKDLVYRPEYDVSSVSNSACTIGTETCITDTWTYGVEHVHNGDGYIPVSSTITGPNGGVATEYFNRLENGGVDPSGSALVYRTVGTDGTVTERYWQGNIPYGTPSFSETNYVKYEFTSILNAAGTLTQTAIREYNYDKNGNVTRVAAFDWVPYTNVLRNGQGRPYAPPSGVQPRTVTVNTYFNPTPDASDSTTNDSDAFQMAGSPRLHRLLESSEVQDGSGTRFSRTELSYDNTSVTGVVSYAIGNPTVQKSWDSTKGNVSAPLGIGNIISNTTTYDAYGNPLVATDAKGIQSQRVYGSINGYSDLYPTQSRAAYGSSVQRYTTAVYDYYTGVVKQSKDEDNNVTTTNSYDDRARAILVENADGKSEETQTATEYSDANRRVIVRSALNTATDGKLVSIQHYDQLGRIRLTRQLEDSTTQSATVEADGIKVQTRYLTSGSDTYQLSSNPYRAASSSAASSEPTMGWTRTRADIGGRMIEAQTFGGAALPAPWASNTTSTGTVTTAYDAQFTTVRDQAGKLRRSMTNGLGQLARVDEPTTAGLGSTTTPNQKTDYIYDPLSNLTQVSQGAQTRTFVYSSLAQLNSAANPESGTVGYTYDNNGNLLTRTDARAVVSTFTYDDLNRNKTVVYTNDPSGTHPVTRRYDSATSYGKGRLYQSETTGTGGSLTTINSYDALGRPLSQAQQFYQSGAWSQPYSTVRSYNRAGGVILQTYPSGHTVNYNYDAAGRLGDDGSNLAFTGKLGDGTQRTYARGNLYSSFGGMTKEQFGTDTAIYNKSFYNTRGQLAEIRLSTSYTGPTDTNRNRGSIINDYSLECSGASCNGTDNNGNLMRQDVFIPHDDAVSASTAWYQKFEYDELNRLQHVKEYNSSNTQLWQQEYEFDRWGNRKVHQTNSWGPSSGPLIPKPNFGVSGEPDDCGAGRQPEQLAVLYLQRRWAKGATQG